MNVLIEILFPAHVAAHVVEAYQSSAIPERPACARELGSIAYPTPTGLRTVYLFDVPDDKVAEFERIQNQRTVFIGSRALGFVATCHVGLTVPETVEEVMPLLA